MGLFENDNYNKFYSNVKVLAKADMSLLEALKIARAHNPAAGQAIARHIYTDTLVPRVGNMFAYKDFLSRNKDHGVHLSMDANSFGAINKEHGFETGNEALKTMFNTVSDVSRKYGLKTFRVGGDEARLHAPTPERAQGFIKELRERLAATPKIAGQHQLSTAIGVGYSPEHAEQALIHAKDKLGPLVNGKRMKFNKPGEEQTVDHSLLHETPPPNWKPSSGKIPTLPHEAGTESVATPGLNFTNPLKKP